MKNTCLWIVFLSFSSLKIEAAIINSSKINWFPLLKQKAVNAFHVCGNQDILPTEKSIHRNFLVGPNETGYLFSNMLPASEFKTMLKTLHQDVGKQAIEGAFKKSNLWKYSIKGGFENLGPPTKVDLPFDSTIKDCMEGSPNNYGHQCKTENRYNLEMCCSEKFPSPTVYWGDQFEYRLYYVPGSGTRLKVPQEKKHRYCNIFDLIQIG